MPIVVDCVLQMDTVQTLRLYKAWKLYERKTDPVTDARIELLEAKDNNGKYQKVAVFHNVGGCDWESAFKPEYGSGYKLKVLLDNGMVYFIFHMQDSIKTGFRE